MNQTNAAERHTAAAVAESKICLALDDLSAERAIELTSKLWPWIYAAKIHDLYDAEGPNIIKELKKAGAKRVWVDAKLHDTKDTVALRTRALVRNGARIITVHASGGIPMMKAAVEAANSECGDVLAVIWAITVLTSLDPGEIEDIYGWGFGREPKQIVFEFAHMAKEAGARGLVCSAQEVGFLSAHPDLAGMKFTVPGTRSAGVALGQQKRSGTLAKAIADGATYLVAGSQVTKASDPVAAFTTFEAEIDT